MRKAGRQSNEGVRGEGPKEATGETPKCRNKRTPAQSLNSKIELIRATAEAPVTQSV